MSRKESDRVWRAKEREADEAIARGEVSKPQKVEDCIASLRAMAVRDKKNAMTYTVLVVGESKKDGGGYIATVPALGAVVTQGDSLKEVRRNICDAIRACVATMRSYGEIVPGDRRPPGRLARNARTIRVHI